MKKIIALLANLSTVLTFVSAHLPQIVPMLPQKYQALVPAVIAALLHFAEFFATPTPSALPVPERKSGGILPVIAFFAICTVASGCSTTQKATLAKLGDKAVVKLERTGEVLLDKELASLQKGVISR